MVIFIATFLMTTPGAFAQEPCADHEYAMELDSFANPNGMPTTYTEVYTILTTGDLTLNYEYVNEQTFYYSWHRADTMVCMTRIIGADGIFLVYAPLVDYNDDCGPQSLEAHAHDLGRDFFKNQSSGEIVSDCGEYRYTWDTPDPCAGYVVVRSIEPINVYKPCTDEFNNAWSPHYQHIALTNVNENEFSLIIQEETRCGESRFMSTPANERNFAPLYVSRNKKRTVLTENPIGDPCLKRLIAKSDFVPSKNPVEITLKGRCGKYTLHVDYLWDSVFFINATGYTGL